MSHTVIGFFDDAADAQRAVERLQSKGISQDRIDMTRGTGNTGSTDYDTLSTSSNSDAHTNSSGTWAEEGADAVDRTAHRTGNAISNFFKSLFGDDDDDDRANRYSRVASRSGAIVTVHANSEEEAEDAADVLDDAGAVDVDERSAEYDRQAVSGTYAGDDLSERTYVATGDDSTTSGRDDDRNNLMDSDRITTGVSALSGQDDTTINRVEENLNVGKREVESGGVRLRSRIVEKPVEETVRLRQEHVHVERNPVNRPLGDADRTGAFQEQNIELTERSEVPVVNKEARVVEEIKLSKDVDERTETIRDTVRSTEVDIDQVGDNNRNNITDGNLDTGYNNNLNRNSDTDYNSDLNRNSGSNESGIR